jgi:nucleotide-binding universal stress UspA family protein
MFKSIVWAADGSESAEKALPVVRELAKEGGATVTIVHVVERVEGIGAVGIPRRADDRQVQTHLEEVAAELTEEGISASLEVRGMWGVAPRTRSRKSRETSAPI